MKQIEKDSLILAANHANAQTDYYNSQIERLLPVGSSKFAPTIKIVDGDGNGQTKWLNINAESAPILIQYLQQFLHKANP